MTIVNPITTAVPLQAPFQSPELLSHSNRDKEVSPANPLAPDSKQNREIEAPQSSKSKRTAGVGKVPFHLYRMEVTPRFRNLVRTRYPALQDHPNNDVYFRILQYLLTATLRDKETGRLVFPHEAVAACVDMHPHNGRFRSEEWLAAFERDMLPLGLSDYRIVRGEARTVSPQIDSAILDALEEDRRQRQDPNSARVYFVTGEVVSRRRKQAEQKIQAAARAQAAQMPAEHPGAELLHSLNQQPQQTLRQLLRHNARDLRAALEQMPRETEHEYLRYEYSVRVMEQIEREPSLVYTTSPGTPRLIAAGVTIASLPRELRQVALCGAYELDLRYCHLAIAARLWNLTDVQSCLEQLQREGRSVWEMLLADLRLSSGRKGILKTTLYSILFGMGKKKLRRQLAEGTRDEDGIGKKAAKRMMNHWLFQSLLQARKAQLNTIQAQGGVRDAFGDWISVNNNILSTLAWQMQSYELYLMSSLQEVFERYSTCLRVLIWLHDGLTVTCTDRARTKKILREMQRTVELRAQGLGLATGLEIHQLQNAFGKEKNTTTGEKTDPRKETHRSPPPPHPG